MSRFDLLFIVLDNLEDEHNRAIAEHVVRMHRYTAPGSEEGMPINEDNFNGINAYIAQMESEDKDTPETQVFEKFDQVLHIGLKPLLKAKKGSKAKKQHAEIVAIPFIRKFIQYAKNNITPVLSAEAAEMISQQYSELRAWEDGRDKLYRVMPITARTLETLIRLSTAHAKCRLSQIVDESDVEVAVEILQYALYKEVKPKKRPVKRTKVNKDGDEEMESDFDEDEDEMDEEEEPAKKSNRSGKTTLHDDEEMDEDEVIPRKKSDKTSKSGSSSKDLTAAGFEASQQSGPSFDSQSQSQPERNPAQQAGRFILLI